MRVFCDSPSPLPRSLPPSLLLSLPPSLLLSLPPPFSVKQAYQTFLGDFLSLYKAPRIQVSNG